MPTFAFYTAPLGGSPCISCYDLPNFTTHPAVKVYRTEFDGSVNGARAKLVKIANRKDGYNDFNYMSMILKESD
jgi:hypothetical protein